ncbi:MAG: AMP-binding protein, partial [Pseudomonadota bacterium]
MGLLQSFSREYTTINTFRGLQKWTKALGPDRVETVADDLEQAVDAHARRIAVRFEGQVATYAELDARANSIAHWALSQGIRAGDTIALFMENRPDYIAIWYGLAKVGVITSLINTNLTGEGLKHCIDTCGASHVITGAEQDAAMHTVLGSLQDEPTLWTLGGTAGLDLEAMLRRLPVDRPNRAYRARLRGKDTCLYVYTSGTTGLPKAAKLSQLRLATMMRSFIAPCNVTEKDRVYVPLPLYHATGGVCAIGIALLTGATVVLRRKFSASAFWDDCADNDVTVFVYIGELCRYLVNQPEHRKERAHSVRAAFGNGLSGDIWQTFSDRFGISKLIEFYASTEGNVRYMNVDGKVGAVGRVPPYLKFAFDHIAIVKYDPATEQPVRDAEGRCMLAAHDEPGEAIGRVGQDGRSSFDGYKDPDATERKVLNSVFEDG